MSYTNIIPKSKWIECAKRATPLNDPQNPWEGITYQPREKGMENQFQPIKNTYGLPMFRKEFACKKTDTVKITATALGIYNLWCNGKRVGTTESDGETVFDEFNPGATVYSRRVMATEYDLANYLVDGDNIILAVVAPGWWRGMIFAETYGESLGMAFCAEIDINGTKIVTDESWKTFWGGRVRAADFYHGELYNANFPSYEDISQTTYDCTDWYTPEIWKDVVIKTPKLGHFPNHNTPISELEIVPFIGPSVRIRKHLTLKPKTVTIYNGTIDNGSDFGEINIVSQQTDLESFTIKKGECAVIDFGQEMVGFPDMTFNASKGTFVQIRVAEMLNDSGLLSRGNDNPKGSVYTINYRAAKSKAYYVAKGNPLGEHYCPMFSFFGYRYLEINATEDLNISNLSALIVGSEIEETGSIQTSNNDVNQLISNVLWGQRSNFLSIPTDCPQRDERQGWTGDTQFFCNTAAYNANVSEFFRKWLTDARDSQQSFGAYQDVIPMVRHWGCGGAAWADAPLIVAHVMWHMYGEINIVKANIASLDRYMDWLATRGVQGPAPTYGDWLAYDPIDKSYICKAYYALDCIIMEELHNALNNTEKAQEYSELYSKIKEDFRNSYIDESGDLLPEYRKQTGYLLALHTNMFNGNEIDAAANSLEQNIIQNGYKLSTGFVGTPILCNTLSKVGKNNIAYSLLMQTEDPSWLYSVHQGATTVWERWNSYTYEKGFGPVNMNSFNHYSFGAITEWMYRYMAGIQSLGVAFENVQFTPKPDKRSVDEIPANQEKITWVKAKYQSKHGLIVSEWEYNEGTYTYYCETPVNAEFVLPIDEHNKYFYVNGQKMNVSDFDISNNCITVKLNKGKYTINI